LASDSRVTLAANSYADVGIKVLCVPYKILHPGYGQDAVSRGVAWEGELGICFAGSAINSFSLKESIVEILKRVQFAPGYTDTSMSGFARYIFTIYKHVSREVCATAVGEKGRATLLVGGRCSETNSVRVFELSTDRNNQSSLTEVLTSDPSHIFIGSGAPTAESRLPPNPSNLDFMKVLKAGIDDEKEPTVGGNIQYGCFEGMIFKVFGIAELGTRVHYWRGAIDLNSDDLMRDDHFVPALTYIDPFKTFAEE
jgi:hypothetical protein